MQNIKCRSNAYQITSIVFFIKWLILTIRKDSRFSLHIPNGLPLETREARAHPELNASKEA